MSRLSAVADHVQGVIADVVGRLPGSVLRILAGGGPVVIDGQTLDAEVQLGLAMMRLAGQRGVDTLTPAQARDEIRRNARVFAGPPIPMARIEPRSIPGPVGPLAARLYVPREDGAPHPLIVFFHGGGWVVGDLDTHDTTCRFLAHEIRAIVLAVDYRLAPEHRFPAAVADTFAAYQWAATHAASLGADPTRVVVAGDSAGGNLAAVVAQLAVQSEGPRPAAQLLIYPATDFSTKYPSHRLFSHGFFLTDAQVDRYRGHYLPDEAAARDPRASPLLATDLRGLPPALVLTAGFDVLRDEGEAYARRMESAGVRVVQQRVTVQIHGFAHATGVSPSARRAMGAAARTLIELLQR